MVTHANVPDPNETDPAIEQMIIASDELAANLSTSRDKWAKTDASLARRIEGLRLQFAAFAAAAKSGRVSNPVVLRTIGRAYECVATALHDLTEDRLAVRECVAKASQLTGAVSDMVERSN